MCSPVEERCAVGRILNRVGEREKLALTVVYELRAEQLRDRHGREARDTTTEEPNPLDTATRWTLATTRLVVSRRNKHRQASRPRLGVERHTTGIEELDARFLRRGPDQRPE